MDYLENARFKIGRLVATPGIMAAFEGKSGELLALLQRHVSGDFGDMAEEDLKANDLAVTLGGARVFSSYNRPELPDGKVWLITEADRSATTFLLPSEY